MPLGPAVRTRLGRFEQPAAEVYRRLFVDLDHLADLISDRTDHPVDRILEIGCGDGAMADRLVQRYPDATYLGIDICPDPGRRYTGPEGHATFRRVTSLDLRAEQPEPYDLVVLVDVIHHIPDEHDRQAVLNDATALAPDGTVVVKDWDAQLSIAHGLQVVADKYLSGDRNVRFTTVERLLDLTRTAMPHGRLAFASNVRPWRNNIVVAHTNT